MIVTIFFLDGLRVAAGIVNESAAVCEVKCFFFFSFISLVEEGEKKEGKMT